ncbi:hypothetical protein BH11CYA1_BH11CYA1_13430 [soil metagenome]
MKSQYFVLALAAIVTTLVSASPAWSYRWGGYNSYGGGYGSGLNALRYILPMNGYRGNGYNYGGSSNYYNRAYNNNNYNNCGRHHHRRWW